jgi:hypothetical protein
MPLSFFPGLILQAFEEIANLQGNEDFSAFDRSNFAFKSLDPWFFFSHRPRNEHSNDYMIEYKSDLQKPSFGEGKLRSGDFPRMEFGISFRTRR